MHWLDAQPSREIDPVLDCLTFLARQADRPSSPVLLRAGLALSDDGHAAVPPDRAGARAGRDARRADHPAAEGLAGCASCPAILELDDDRAAVLLEMRDGDGADLRARHRRADVGHARRARAGLHRPRGRRRSRPDPRARERAAVGQGQAHALVLVRSVEGPPRILAGPAGRADRQPARARDAAVHDERLRPGHPEQGGVDPVGAGARRGPGARRSTSSCASRGRS